MTIKLMRVLRNVSFCLTLLFFNHFGGATNTNSTGVPSVRSQVAKILLSSLGGAVLGISTLSFYDRPQDHISNVAIGGTLGALIGSVYVTQESLKYESYSSIESGGTFSVSAFPSQKYYSLNWGFSY